MFPTRAGIVFESAWYWLPFLIDYTMQEVLHHFYLTKQEPLQSCLLALRGIILKQSHQLAETMKYGMPCFCYKQKAVCYLWTDKRTGEPYLLWVNGNQITHPALESGGRKRMKILRIRANEDLPVDAIVQILQDALML